MRCATSRRRWSGRASIAADDRRRDDEPRAHGGEDPSELPARAGGLCQRRQPRGRRGAVADVGRASAGYVAELRGEYAKIAAAHARAQEDKVRLPLAAARANALKLDWSGAYVPPKPRFIGTADAERLSDHGTGRVYRLDAVLPDLGVGRQVPGHSRRCEGRRGGARALRGCAHDARHYRGREVVQGECGGRFLAGQCARRRHSCLCRRDTHEPITVLHSLRQQLSKREGRANGALVGFRRAARQQACRLYRRLHRHRGNWRGRSRRAFQARQ